MTFTFRRLDRPDFDLLARWLAQPHVNRWWYHQFTAEAVEADFGPTADGDEPAEDWLVLMPDDDRQPGDPRPIGLIQWCWYCDYDDYVAEMEPVHPVGPGDGSIDYLIGEPTHVGRGLGTAMIAAFVERQWSIHPDLERIVVPVNAANEASWRALAKVGFDRVAEGELEADNPIDDPDHVIMGLRRPTVGDGDG